MGAFCSDCMKMISGQSSSQYEIIKNEREGHSEGGEREKGTGGVDKRERDDRLTQSQSQPPKIEERVEVS